KKTVATPVSTNAHHCQLPATPCVRTKFVTRLGVSLENVVATMESPASHQGTARPDAKYSVVFFPDRRAKKSAGMKQTAIDATTITQSIGCRCMGCENPPRHGPAWKDRDPIMTCASQPGHRDPELRAPEASRLEKPSCDLDHARPVDPIALEILECTVNLLERIDLNFRPDRHPRGFA